MCFWPANCTFISHQEKEFERERGCDFGVGCPMTTSMNLNHGEVRRVFALAALGPGDAVAMARLAAGAGVPEGVPFARAPTELLVDGVAELDGLGRSSAGLHVEVVILQ